MVKLVDLRWNGLSHDLSMLPTPNACACGSCLIHRVGLLGLSSIYGDSNKKQIKIEKVVVVYISAARIWRYMFAYGGMWKYMEVYDGI